MRVHRGALARRFPHLEQPHSLILEKHAVDVRSHFHGVLRHHCLLARCSCSFRPPPTTGRSPTGLLVRARSAEIRLLRAAPRVRIRDAQCRALALLDLFAAAVTDKHGFPGHYRLLVAGDRRTLRVATRSMQVPGETPALSRSANASSAMRTVAAMTRADCRSFV